jgi:hypothetical protein
LIAWRADPAWVRETCANGTRGHRPGGEMDTTARETQAADQPARAATAIVALAGLARVALGLDAPADVLLGAVIGVTIPLLAFRWFTPNEVFPVSYRRGRSAHLDIEGNRGQAIRRALQDRLGLTVEEVKPFGLAGSAGSTPLRIKLKGDPPSVLFGKLYARGHLRSDRWYKLGRELLYGRLEDERRSTPSVGWSSRRTTRCGCCATRACPRRRPTGWSS